MRLATEYDRAWESLSRPSRESYQHRAAGLAGVGQVATCGSRKLDHRECSSQKGKSPDAYPQVSRSGDKICHLRAQRQARVRMGERFRLEPQRMGFWRGGADAGSRDIR